MDIWLNDLRTYARCPLEWFWEKRAGYPRPRTVASLQPEAIQTALAFYYQAYADTLSEAIGLVWRDWCEAWGDVAVATELTAYAEGRARILALFEKGLLAPPGGGRYKMPQMTNAYRDRMHRAGLTRLGHRLDEFARVRNLLLPDANTEAESPGGVLGDTFADCLQASERVMQNPKFPLPDRSVVLGWQVPYQAELGQTFWLKGVADLVLRAVPDSGDEAVVLEVHDYQPMPGLRMGLAARDLRVIAASLARPCEGGSPPLAWQQVSQVLYRHWPTGEAYEFRETNSGYLQALLAATARGMSGQVIIPRALTGFEDCRPCAYREQCWSAGWDTLPLVDASTLGLAEELREITHQVREQVGQDGQATHRVLEGLKRIEDAVRRFWPDRFAAEALLRDVRDQLEVIQNEAA